jgi:hypothetical protein
LFDFVRQFLALARVLPLGRLLALHNLQQVQMLLFQLFLLRQELVETDNRKKKKNFFFSTNTNRRNVSNPIDFLIFYLACLTAWIQALQSLSDSARSS